ncbi:hypothetical protein Y696_00185 [Mesotoga sp. H07pep.5.4]|nr:DUF4127 family protein [Mesotoga sp. H07pep.5.4]RLL82557.1 hypothetical protein Y696_00185 [Mesotoga sp. H07pep.5.4]
MKTVVVPMDDRPPNYQLVSKIADLNCLEIELPDKNLLGRYLRPGNCEELARWMLSREADRFIVSVDMLSYGGLIASREDGISTRTAIDRLSSVRELRRRFPNAEILLSSIVRRASVSVSSAGSKELWTMLNNYLWLSGNERIKEAEAVEDELPRGFVGRYRELRLRNHEVNKECLKLVKAGCADILVLAQEDTFQHGPQERELAILEDMAKDYVIDDRIFIHNGADEVIQEMLSYRRDQEYPIEVIYDSPETREKIMDFEDREFGKNVESHMKFLGMRQSSGSSTGILVAGTKIDNSIEALKNLSERKQRVFILDVFCANGSSHSFVDAYLGLDLKNIWGYSAWNTASNSLGTLLSLAATSSSWEVERKAFTEFYISRLLDDHLYQGILRNTLERMVDESGGDIYKVSKSKGLFEDFRDNLFMPKAEEFLDRFIRGRKLDIFDFSSSENRISIEKFILPWDRTFECEIEVMIR